MSSLTVLPRLSLKVESEMCLSLCVCSMHCVCECVRCVEFVYVFDALSLCMFVFVFDALSLCMHSMR